MCQGARYDYVHWLETGSSSMRPWRQVDIDIFFSLPSIARIHRPWNYIRSVKMAKWMSDSKSACIDADNLQNLRQWRESPFMSPDIRSAKGLWFHVKRGDSAHFKIPTCFQGIRCFSERKWKWRRHSPCLSTHFSLVCVTFPQIGRFRQRSHFGGHGS